MAAVAASNKRAERAALDEVADIVAAAVRRWDADGTNDQGLFGRIVDAWSSEPPDIRLRGIAFDVALIHIASMSNLAAALGWALVDLLEHPAHLARVVAGDADLAQRLRAGVHPSGAALDHVPHRAVPGVFGHR